MAQLPSIAAATCPCRRVIENKKGLLTQGTRRYTINLSRANTLAGGSLRTSTRIQIGARLTFRVNANTDARTWYINSTSVKCLFTIRIQFDRIRGLPIPKSIQYQHNRGAQMTHRN